MAAVPAAWRRLRCDKKATIGSLNLEQANAIIDRAQELADGGELFPQAMYQARQDFQENHKLSRGHWVEA